MREILGEYFGEICVVTAVFDRYSKTPEGSNMVCYRDIRIEGRLAADHVWVHRSKAMKQADMKAGDRVEFLARVGHYPVGIPRPHVEAVQYDYCLEKISEFAVIERLERETNG